MAITAEKREAPEPINNKGAYECLVGAFVIAVGKRICCWPHIGQPASFFVGITDPGSCSFHPDAG